MQEQIEAVKRHALEHYNDGGWDVIVECYEDREIEAYLTECGTKTVAEAINAFKPLVDVWNDREQDAINSAF